jgi:quinol monooxygenase YgiN
MLLFGVGWTSAYATIQAAAQLACPPWVRARSLAIYQLAQNGALTLGSFAWGVLGGQIGIASTLVVAAGVGVVLAMGARYFRIEAVVAAPAPTSPEPMLTPEAPAAALAPMLRNARNRVMEMAHYRVDPGRIDAFMAVMREVRHVRGRAGAQFWQLYEDVAHPEGWIEIWSMESWTDHLRESARRTETDKLILARAAVFQQEAERPSRYLAVDPLEHRADQAAPVRTQRPHMPVARTADGLNNA